jgi:hypothetical protein
MSESPALSGVHRDRLLGPAGELVVEWPWEHNLIVDSLRRLLAALVKGDPQGAPVRFWAVGTGDPAWDAGIVPSEAARRTRATLFAETARKPVPPGQITFVGGTLTNQLEITMQLTTADIPGGPASWSLREFGLFAAGSAAPGSGLLLNHRIHPRIDMQAGFTLERTLRLTF